MCCTACGRSPVLVECLIVCEICVWELYAMLKNIVHEWMLLAVVPCTKASSRRESDRAQAVFAMQEGSYYTAEPGSRC